MRKQVNIPKPNLTIAINPDVLLDNLEQIGRSVWQDPNGELWYMVTKNNGYGKIVITNDEDWAEKYLFHNGNSASNPS